MVVSMDETSRAELGGHPECIPIQEARQGLTDLAKRAKAGEVMIITSYGKAVAALVSPPVGVDWAQIAKANMRATGVPLVIPS